MMLKTKKLLEAITLMSDLFKYEDKVQSEFKLNISEAQPSFAAGRLFELLYDELLTDRGLTIVDDFLFDGVTYDEDTPYEIVEEIDELEAVYKITNPEELCLYLENKGMIKR